MARDCRFVLMVVGLFLCCRGTYGIFNMTLTEPKNGSVVLNYDGFTECRASVVVNLDSDTSGSLEVYTKQNATQLITDNDVKPGTHRYTLTTEKLPGIGEHSIGIHAKTQDGNDSFTSDFVAIVEIQVEGARVENSLRWNICPCSFFSKYVIPGQEFVVHIKGQDGEEPLSTIDFQELVRLIKLCDGNLLEVNHKNSADNTATFHLFPIATNISPSSRSISIVFMYELNGFDVSADAQFVQPTEESKFTISLASASLVPMGNLTLFLDCGGITNSTKQLIINPTETQQVSCMFSIQGNYTIKLDIMNDAGNIANSFDLLVCDILNVALCLDSAYHNAIAKIPFYLTNLPSSGFQYHIDFDNGLILENSSSDILYSSYSPIDLSDINYSEERNYSVVFKAYNFCSNIIQYIDVVFDEAVITWSEKLIFVGTTYVIDVDIAKGSKSTISISYVEMVFFSDNCTYLHSNHTYNSGGLFRIGVLIGNQLRNRSEHRDLQVLYPYNGITIGLKENQLQTTENATFYIMLNRNARVPIGDLTVTISPCGTSDLKEILSMLPNDMKQFVCFYTPQGNYSVNITIESPFGTEESLIKDITIWDKLNVSLQIDKTSFEVYYQPVFQILDAPPFGFKYIIDFGESTIIEQQDSAIFIKPYTDIEIPRSFKYNKPGQYAVKFNAYNDLYSVSYDQYLTVEYRLPDSYLQVSPKRTLVIPDDIATFKIHSKSNSSVDKPTNVTCDIDYGDGVKLTREPTEFDYDLTGLGLTLTHRFTRSSTFTVTLNCSNMISSIAFTYRIRVVEFHAEDFNISFSATNLLNETAAGLFQLELQLYDLTTPPQNIKLEWNFGDGSEAEIDDPMTSFVKQHTYTERGSYSVQLSITYDERIHLEDLTINMGACGISLVSSADYGLVSVTQFDFRIDNYLLGIPVNVEVIWGDESTSTVSFTPGETNKAISHIFQVRGTFRPMIQATCSLGTEYSFLATSFFIDNPVQDLTWKFPAKVIAFNSFSTELVYNNNLLLTNLTCIFDYWEETMTKEHVNFSTESPRIFSPVYSFQTIGDVSLSVNCSNRVSYQKLTHIMIVLGGCFTMGRMFSPEYRNMNTSLKAYRSSMPVFSERIEIDSSCENSTGQSFEWKVRKQISTGWIKMNVISPNSKVYDMSMSNIGAGFYRVSCRLTLFGPRIESVEDYMYLELLDPPLVAEIAGGRQIILGNNTQFILNAITQSFDPVIGYGRDNKLSFSWQCYQIAESELDSYVGPEATDITYRDRSPCGINFMSTGWITASTSSLQSKAWYLFEAIVSKDTRSASALQAIHVVDEVPIETFLICKWNCEFKRARLVRMVYEANFTCSNCTDAQLKAAMFEWFFYKYNGHTYDLVSNSDPHFLSAPNASVFDLDADFMEIGKGYKLTVTVSIEGIDVDGWASTSFVVNQEPYDGTCSVFPTTGNATTTDFTFECISWKDEGPRDHRNSTVDASEPLTYVITQLKGTESQIIYDGNEALSIQKLEVCPKETNYLCSIEFKIRDLFKAETVVLFDVTVLNPSPDLTPISFETPNKPMDINEHPMTRFLQNSDVAIKIAKMSNDSENTAKLASAHLSSINTMELPTVTSSRVADAAKDTDGNVNTIVANTLTKLTSPDPLLNRLQETTETLTKAIMESIELLAVAPFHVGPGNTDSNGNVLPTTTPSVDLLILMASTLATTIKEPKMVKPSVQTDVTNGALTLSKVLLDTLKYSRDISQIERAIAAIGAAESNLNKNQAGEKMVEDVEDLDGSEDFVTRNLTEGEKMFNAIERKFTNKLIEKSRQVERNRKKKYVEKSRAVTEEITNNLFALMDRIQMDGTTKNIKEEGFGLSLEKDTMENIVNGDRKPLSGANFHLGGVSNKTMGNKERVRLQLKVMKNNIYSEGDNAKLVNSPVVVARVKKQDGSSVSISNPVIKQTDPVKAPYTLITPKFIKEDAAKLFYHSFFYRSLKLHVCISALPVNNISVVYDVFLRCILPPTDIDYDHYTSYKVEAGVSGTRYCVSSGALKRTGVVFLGLRPRLNTVDPVSRQRRSVLTGDETLSNDNTTTSDTDSVLETPYMFRITTIACFFWNATLQDWRSNECQLSRDEDKNATSCTCPDSLDVVASVSFFVAPNKIDFSTVFSKFDIVGQGAVLGTLILIIVIFVLAALYSRYKDGQDVLQWGVSLLADNFREDCYFYLITVYTGMIRQGGTRSTVEFSISGEQGDTGIRVLTDGIRKEFSAGSVLRFVMAVPHSLGNLQCFAVWHDNSGKGNWASWYLNRVEILDLQTKEKTDFLCYKWLSLEAGMLQTAMGAENSQNVKNFKRIFFEHARHHMTDDHLWLSTVLRPVKSHFSRVQRVGCCFALLLLSMISNAMFFQGKDFKDRKQSADFELGPIKFTLSQIWISLVSAVITAVPVFLMMLLFRKSKLSKSQTSTGDFTSHWMLPCFKRFKFYKDSVALQKVLVIKDIVDDEEGVLPHACVYVGWVLVFAAAVTSSFFVMLYSMEWGKDISEEFLLAFFMSFVESMFILDPFKIVFLAVLFSLILRQIKSVQPTVFDLNHIGTMNSKIGKPTQQRRHVDYKSPFSESEIKVAKFTIEQKTKMYKAISEFMVTVFLLVLLCSICYSNRDPHSFILRTTLSNQLISPGKPVFPMTKVRSVRDYYHWLNYTVLPAMFPQEHYNKDVLGSFDRQFVSDQTNIRVGAPRLRLVRQNKKACSLPYISTIDCIPRYFVVTEDVGDYCRSWNATKPCDEDEGLKITSAAWTFVPAWKIWGIPIEGTFNVYGGGGYIAELDISWPVAKATIHELVESMWIDRQTRAVFLEFTVYCTNLNMFAYISLLAEFPETGSIIHYPNIYTFRSLGATGTLGIYVIICEILFMITTVIWMGVIGFRMLKERLLFFQRFWNIIEFATVCLSFAAVVLYFIKVRYTSEAIAKFKENNRVFVNFYHIAVWDNFFIMVVSIVIAILTIRLIKVMGYTRFTRTVYTVLKQSSKTLPDFFFYIVLVLLAFAITGYLHFGSEVKEYRDLLTCLESLFSGVLGHAGFTKMDIPLENNWFGLIYFITFIIMVVFTVANIFMAILLDTMDMLAKDRSAERDLELTTFLWDSVQEIVTGKKEDGTFKAKHEQTQLGRV